jgi:hypothetical protein
MVSTTFCAEVSAPPATEALPAHALRLHALLQSLLARAFLHAARAVALRGDEYNCIRMSYNSIPAIPPGKGTYRIVPIAAFGEVGGGGDRHGRSAAAVRSEHKFPVISQYTVLVRNSVVTRTSHGSQRTF